MGFNRDKSPQNFGVRKSELVTLWRCYCKFIHFDIHKLLFWHHNTKFIYKGIWHINLFFESKRQKLFTPWKGSLAQENKVLRCNFKHIKIKYHNFHNLNYSSVYYISPLASVPPLPIILVACFPFLVNVSSILFFI